jgi:CO/xanthine dehydrogenase FAD-binding subunit
LAYVGTDGAALRIGGLTRLEELSKAPALVAFAGGLVAEAARLTCTSLLRSQGTLAGTILSRSANGELASALLVLDAEVLLQTLEGPITRHISHLLENPEACKRAILIDVRLTEPPFGWCINRERIARTPGDRAILSVTVVARVVDGSIVECRIAVTGAGLRPMRLRNVEALLAGAAARADIIDSVLKKEALLLEMPDNTLASAEYRRAMLPVLISRAILGSSR